jgi:DNA-directed RNA polymerase I, II, and III subunit RPABC2
MSNLEKDEPINIEVEELDTEGSDVGSDPGSDDDDISVQDEKLQKKEAIEEAADDDDDDDEDDEEEAEEEDEDDDLEEQGRGIPKVATEASKFAGMWSDDDEDDDDEEDEDDNYIQKFDETMKQNVISNYHPELSAHNSEEVELLATVVRDEHGNICDPLHRTVPFITKYEKARILGERAKQLDAGATAMIDVEPTLIDGYLIALKEYEQKKIPFIIKRPLPHGGCEYWRFSDLEAL